MEHSQYRVTDGSVNNRVRRVILISRGAPEALKWYFGCLEQINLWWEIRKRVNCFSDKEESRRKALCLARFDDEV